MKNTFSVIGVSIALLILLAHHLVLPGLANAQRTVVNSSENVERSGHVWEAGFGAWDFPEFVPLFLGFCFGNAGSGCTGGLAGDLIEKMREGRSPSLLAASMVVCRALNIPISWVAGEVNCELDFNARNWASWSPNGQLCGGDRFWEMRMVSEPVVTETIAWTTCEASPLGYGGDLVQYSADRYEVDATWTYHGNWTFGSDVHDYLGRRANNDIGLTERAYGLPPGIIGSYYDPYTWLYLGHACYGPDPNRSRFGPTKPIKTTGAGNMRETYREVDSPSCGVR